MAAEKMEAIAANSQLRIEGIASVAAATMAEPTTDDQQLLRQICQGDEAAFAALYNRHQGPIYRFVLHMSGSSATAEEVTQEVFMHLIRRPKAYKPDKGSLSAYLFGIARNLARRALQPAPGIPLDDCEKTELTESDDLNALDNLSRSEMLNFLRRALLSLPEAYREAIVLCDLEEIDYAGAAAMLECSPGTIASRLHRAHAMLRLKLSRAMGSKPCLT